MRSFEAWALRGSERPGSDYMSMAYVTDSAFPADELSPGREMLFEGFSFPVPARAESYLERYTARVGGNCPRLRLVATMLQLSSTSEAIRRCGSEAPDKLMFKKYTYLQY